MSDDCLLCGAAQPAGHVLVQGTAGEHVGRICSSHSLFEVATAASDDLLLEIVQTRPPKAQRRRARAGGGGARG